MIAIDRARQASRTRCHCSKNRNCVSLCSRISAAQRADHRATADGSRCAMAGSHAVQAIWSCASFTAMNSAKSSSQSAWARQKPSKRVRIGVPDRRIEAIEHARPQCPAVGDHRREVDMLQRERARVAGLRFREQSVLNQLFEADEQGIAGKRGEALVRRVAVASRSEREHLP